MNDSYTCEYCRFGGTRDEFVEDIYGELMCPLCGTIDLIWEYEQEDNDDE